MELEELNTESSELSLVRAAQEGDREAFGQLARRYERAVYSIALRRLGNHAERRKFARKCWSARCRRSRSSGSRRLLVRGSAP